MKMVKSLLLGTAAGLVAMTGAQAADLPVKAKPVQYVKICSLYGAGFYYIPGTDTCIKVGGFVRVQTTYNVNGNSTNGPLMGNANNRTTNDFTWRQRGYVTLDVRNQTEYGTVRSYSAIGYTGDITPAISVNRQFVQLAGFTIGISQSFYDFYSQPASQYYGYGGASDTGDGGQQVWAYTAQFGNGLSASISAEGATNRRMTVVNGGTLTQATFDGAFVSGGAVVPSSYGGTLLPEVVANLRVDQAWGSAQIMGAAHQVTGQYYGTTEGTGGPGAQTGWAVGAGVKVLFPMLGPGDYFQAQGNYTKGASRYVVDSSGITTMSAWRGNSFGYGAYTDGVYGAAGTSIDLTTVWGVNAAYDHYWSKAWQTSLWGAYNATSYSATANTLLCAAATITGTCNHNFAAMAIGSRTQWNIDSNTNIGVELVYTKLDQQSSGTIATTGTIQGKAAGPYAISDQDAWAGYFRVQRAFWP